MNRLGKMREKPDKPLTPVELFRRGIEMTQMMRGKIIEARAYYLGRSPEPTNRRINHHQTATPSKPSPPFCISPTNRGKSSNWH